MNLFFKIFSKSFKVKEPKQNKSLNNLTDFLFEIAYLSKVKRSQVKNNNLTISDHSYRVTMISLILAERERKIDLSKLLIMALIHDLPETRIGDLDLINKCYVDYQETKALNDQLSNFSFKNKWLAIFNELLEGKTKEAIIVHEADILDEMLTDKNLLENGTKAASGWLDYFQNSLKTTYGKKIGKTIVNRNMNDWWQQIVLKKFKYK